MYIVGKINKNKKIRISYSSTINTSQRYVLMPLSPTHTHTHTKFCLVQCSIALFQRTGLPPPHTHPARILLNSPCWSEIYSPTASTTSVPRLQTCISPPVLKSYCPSHPHLSLKHPLQMVCTNQELGPRVALCCRHLLLHRCVPGSGETGVSITTVLGNGSHIAPPNSPALITDHRGHTDRSCHMPWLG